MKKMKMERKDHAPSMIVISGFTDELTREEKELAGAILAKPIREKYFRELLQEYYSDGGNENDIKTEKYALIADDSQTYRIALKQFLLKKGIKVYEASNGAEALMVMESYKVDFVICDNQMPEMSGFEFASTAHERFPEVSIYMVSALLTDLKEAV